LVMVMVAPAGTEAGTVNMKFLIEIATPAELVAAELEGAEVGEDDVLVEVLGGVLDEAAELVDGVDTGAAGPGVAELPHAVRARASAAAPNAERSRLRDMSTHRPPTSWASREVRAAGVARHYRAG